MKMTAFLLLVLCLQVGATGTAQKITLCKHDAPIQQVFDAIERQSGYLFFYKSSLINSDLRITIDVKDVSVDEAIKKSLENLPLAYSIMDRIVIIREKRLPVIISTITKDHLEMATYDKVFGTVTDTQGNPLVGVSVVVKGTSRGTSTSNDGSFEIEANKGDVFEFTFVGYKTASVTFNGQDEIKVELVQDVGTGLEEVVVTALGISREKRSLGYSSQQITGEDVSTNNTGNVTNSLAGKVSGVQIKSSGNIGGSTNIVIRGYKSLTGNNQALWVVDGVPVDNSNWNTADQKNSSIGYDYGNMASDINQDDIESINILKGAAATALYGSRASNGAVIITTKSGPKNVRAQVNVNTRFLTGNMDKSTFPDYQTEYGGGYGPLFGPNSDSYFNSQDINGDGILDLVAPNPNYASSGAPYESQQVYDWYSLDFESPQYLKPNKWELAKNGPSSFYEHPNSILNNASVSGGGENYNYRFAFTNYNEKGILPNSQIRRNNISIKSQNRLSDKITINGEANYVQEKTVGRNMTGSVGGNGNNVSGVFRQYWQLNADIELLKEMYFKTRRNVTNFVGGTIDNVYWLRYEVFSRDRRDRIFGNVSLNYKLNDNINIEGRVSLDNYTFLTEEMRNNGSIKLGYYGRNDIHFQEINYDLLLNFNKDFGSVLNLNGFLGTNLRRQRQQSIFNETNGGLVVTGIYAISNSMDPPAAPEENLNKVGVNGIFGLLSMGFKDFLYLDLTGRNDVSSTLPSQNNSYFYPSVSTSFIFTRFLKSKTLSFGKLRVNYAIVGSDAPVHSLVDVLVKPVPFGSLQLYSVNHTKNNPELRPEKTRSFEVGVETQFFNNRLSADITFYKTNTRDQIIPILLSASTGYQSRFVNAGNMENKGIEIGLGARIINKGDWGWNLQFNWSENKNKVVSLIQGLDNLVIGYRGGYVTAEVGEPYGTIVGRDFIYKDGQRVINQSTGEYERTNESNVILGNMNPNWMGGITNNIRFKKFSLNFLIDFQKGGDIFSQDMGFGIGRGLYKITAGLNDLGNPVRNTLSDGGGLILDGVDENGNKNGVRTDMSVYTNAFSSTKAPDALFIYDASFLKLRSLQISYQLPIKKMSDGKIKNSINLSLIGQNLWIIHKNIPNSDPEAGIGSGNLQGIQQGVLPTFRRYGLGLGFQF